jgi:hypothetical protein
MSGNDTIAAAREAWAIRTEVDVVALLEKPKQLPPKTAGPCKRYLH